MANPCEQYQTGHRWKCHWIAAAKSYPSSHGLTRKSNRHQDRIEEAEHENEKKKKRKNPKLFTSSLNFSPNLLKEMVIIITWICQNVPFQVELCRRILCILWWRDSSPRKSPELRCIRWSRPCRCFWTSWSQGFFLKTKETPQNSKVNIRNYAKSLYAKLLSLSKCFFFWRISNILWCGNRTSHIDVYV